MNCTLTERKDKTKLRLDLFQERSRGVVVQAEDAAKSASQDQAGAVHMQQTAHRHGGCWEEQGHSSLQGQSW